MMLLGPARSPSYENAFEASRPDDPRLLERLTRDATVLRAPNHEGVQGAPASLLIARSRRVPDSVSWLLIVWAI
jgi:hypothetical protein